MIRENASSIGLGRRNMTKCDLHASGAFVVLEKVQEKVRNRLKGKNEDS